ncbi:hypothetical protein GCM10017608_19580 [Agromyces luteolus]|uniref:TfoX N-terminal domain-containing protein n=1 Tax=Agromyces luteolus TaxID=88373 RepID=A0A7C9HIQ5_9MICO|nr:hypothetical protein [Agromyces luteolus]MUN07963.1 hypothetical protein [Agromyces luteolus]GLK28024.1 hypothetical protein GCM10017608_19580 [Agromyces luteolus]
MDARTRGRERLAEATADLIARPDVSVGRMFGSEGYSVRGKLFAFVEGGGDLVVKLPEERIAELALAPMVMRGRPMREWAVVPSARGDEWATIAGDALAFVDEITP